MSLQENHPFKLLIVESPLKAKTIETYLGTSYKVRSCNGHIRDLPKKALSVDVEKGFLPHYVIKEEKKSVVKELMQLAKKADEVILAPDKDREGESIAYHLTQALDLDEKKTKRITFTEITKQAIQDAINHPRYINLDLVYSQQARRILDRLVGYDLSPLLWRKIKPGLSAGRVQTVAVRLVVERERLIRTFISVNTFQVSATFSLPDNTPLQATLSTSLSSYEEAEEVLQKYQKSHFVIQDIQQRAGTEKPSPPFMTSTLQQVASNQLGYSVARTMRLAQRLYEEGHITYMRTDSVNLSEEILAKAKKEITSKFGSKYHLLRRYKSKSKLSQEAHEAIRPTNLQEKIVTKDPDLQRLYLLIWQRTLASQMAATQLAHTTIVIKPNTTEHTFLAKGQVITFDGFLILYENASQKKSKTLPPLTKESPLSLLWIKAREHFSKPPKPRYTEASLVRELEVKGIGRPSTYVPIIQTIQQRQYVVRESREGKERTCRVLLLEKDTIKAQKETETFGTEKNKLFPTDIALSVNDFLVERFQNITDYQFTAHMEEKLDEIADKKQPWQEMLKTFYTDFKPKVTQAADKETNIDLVRTLGEDPVTGKPVIARLSKRYGSLVQLGEMDGPEKPRFASLMPNQLLETLTLKDALILFQLPRTVATFEKDPIIAQIGRFGPYLKHQEKFYSLSKDYNPYTIQEADAIQVIQDKRDYEAKSVLKVFSEDPTLQIRQGRWGLYLKASSGNYKLDPKSDPAQLTFEACQKIISEAPPKRKKKVTKRK